MSRIAEFFLMLFAVSLLTTVASLGLAAAMFVITVDPLPRLLMKVVGISGATMILSLVAAIVCSGVVVFGRKK